MLPLQVLRVISIEIIQYEYFIFVAVSMKSARKSQRQQSTRNKSFGFAPDQSSEGLTEKDLRKRPAIAYFQDIQNYQKIDKLNLTQNNMENINRSLALEEMANKQVEARLKVNDLFVRYEENPFIQQFQKRKNEGLTTDFQYIGDEAKDKKSAKNKEITLVAALNSLKEKLNKQTQKRACSPAINNLLDIHHQEKRHRVIDTSTDKKIRAEMKHIYTKSRTRSPSILASESSRKSATGDSLKKSFAELDEIVKMSDESFFRKQIAQKDINIFSVLFVDKSKWLDYGGGSLKKNHFCQISNLKASQAAATIDVSGISSKARQMASRSNQKSRQVPKIKDQSYFNIDNIALEDMIGVAQGRIIPQMLDITTKDLYAGLDQQAKEVEIAYKPNLLNKTTLKTSKEINVNDSQVGYFKNEPLTQRQTQQLQFSQECKQQLEKILKMQQFSHKKTINDRQIGKSFDKSKNQVLHSQMDGYIGRKYDDVERKVRMNKLQKDRCESIKNKVMLATLISKKVYENSWKSKSKSRSKSKMSYWR